MRLFLVLAGIVTRSLAEDIDFKCKPGEQISKVSSLWDNQGTDETRKWQFDCQMVPGKAQPTCAYTKPLQCNDKDEGCDSTKGQWLAGMQAIYVGGPVPLIASYCCQDSNTVLRNCNNFTLLNFQHSSATKLVPSGQAFSGIRCFLIKDRQDNIYDAVVKVQTCSFATGSNPTSAPGGTAAQPSATPSSSGSNGNCPPCDCNCFINNKPCPANQQVQRFRRHTIIERRNKRENCHCVCECQSCV